MSLAEQKELEAQYVMPTFGRSDVEFVSGEGMYLTDAQGKTYLDFLSGIGVCSLGHCHPVVVDALTTQASKLIHVSNYFYIEHRGQLAQKLSQLLNDGVAPDQAQPWKTFFANSGAEANECAIKLARRYAKRRAEERGEDPADAPFVIVTLVKSFHGRTLATLAATGQSRFHKGFEPIPGGFATVPINDVEALRALFDSMGSSICAVMVEAVQGESGVHVCNPDFLKGVRSLCDAHDALMICDEVQCGIFRTGKPFGFQYAGVVPDIVTMAKGIASGVPAGACAARGGIGDALTPGEHGSTFGGSNLAVSTALATLEELSSKGYATQITATGANLMQALRSLEGVQTVRGLGLMVGADLADGIDAHAVVAAALDEGLVINATGEQTLRFLPPLICTAEQVQQCAQLLARAIAHVSDHATDTRE